LSAVGIVRATLCKPSRGPTSLISTDTELSEIKKLLVCFI